MTVLPTQKSAVAFCLRQAFPLRPTSDRRKVIRITTLNGRLHPPVNQQQQANSRQHDQLPPAAFADVMQAAGTDRECGQHQTECDQAIDGLTQHAGGERDQYLEQKKPPEFRP